ncbi:timeless-domain-containing protein [Gloeophyllum trabeum ATCC 11539]|uniref:Timeless-domain-containing protein n=1 Tax=Gloeophyllum trabeum (strain ATCC 11539 / FP-39264 / Madison 617) TaxID=670483 RepID=S7PTL5_GLOTA|nr:timeless-domain-containing protein [Gloeophyllum trabeum ATCC 11539]EPQ50778.1 timeless-domain-containing protein [Gloeophyllum trabeum ATCC 11539]
MDDGDLSHESEVEQYVDRRTILEPAISSVVDALGGYENGRYRLGDEAYGCLKDLKKFWRKDDTDDERTVARIFWDTRVLPNDLVPILLATAGQGEVEDKRAVACVDLMAAMTWPIDLAEELKELDEDLDKGTDYTQLLTSHLHYKAAILKEGVLEAMFGIVVPCITKDKKERKERDVQIINVVLYLIRNLAFIKDPPPNMYASSDRTELSSLQSKLVKRLSESHLTDLIMTIASNALDPLYNPWNTLALEIFYLMFRGVTPSSLALDQAKQPTATLHRLLEVENRIRRDVARSTSSRHSRFGTTISVKLNPKRGSAGENSKQAESVLSSQTFVMHRQQAIGGEAGSIIDLTKKQRAPKTKKVDELAREDNLSMEARTILQNLARTFVESALNPFLASLLKDIKAERAKITEKDNLRLLYVTKWFLEFFLRERAARDGKDGQAWDFGLIAEVTDRGWIVWVLKRMREAVDEKPKLWTELQAGIECLTQLLALIDSMMSSADVDPTIVEAAEILQQQLIYSGEVLDVAFESLRSYREGTQSLAYLGASVNLAHSLFKMLEKWSKTKGEMYVRKRVKSKKKKGKGKETEEGEGVPDVEDVESASDNEDLVRETTLTMEAFELRFAHSEINHTLLAYLSRYKEYSSAEEMRRIVKLLHRQAVKAKAEGLFFQASTLDLFKTILADQKSLPKDQPYKDLVALINYILRQFFKAVDEEPLVLVEAFFPKNRGTWKRFSSWEPDKKVKAEEQMVEDKRFPPDVQVKKGYSWSEQVGIAVACLTDDGKRELVEWVKDILSLVIAQRRRIVEETDGSSSKAGLDSDAESDAENVFIERNRGPSEEALAKFTDYLIPYINDEQADAATRNPHLKLIFRLLKFEIVDEDADELEWHVPKSIPPDELQSGRNVIDQFLENPIDLDGKKAASLLTKKARRRTRRRQATPDSDAEVELLDDEPKKRAKKKKENKQYKSAQFIEDSDGEEEDIKAFFEKEKQLRERMALAAVDGKIATMRPTGTKKRRKKDGEDKVKQRKKRKGDPSIPESRSVSVEKSEHSDSDDSESGLGVFGSPRVSPASTSHTSPPAEASSPKPSARPRPKPRFRRRTSSPGLEPPQSTDPPDDDVEEGDRQRSEGSGSKPRPSPAVSPAALDGGSDEEEADQASAAAALRPKPKGRLVLSDDED